MFDKLIDVLLEWIDQLLPFTVIPHYNRGVRLRLGQNKGRLEPGFHWKIPFADDILVHMVKTTTLNLSEQTITTKDWKQIVAAAVIKYEVDDVEILLLEVNDPIDALSDIGKGIIRDVIINKNWDECNNEALTNTIEIKIRAQAKKWGIAVKEVTMTDLGEIPSFRLMNSNTTNLLN